MNDQQTPQTIKGQPPNAQDAFWLGLAQGLSPDKSIERLDAYGKYLLATISVVGTVLGGFGIISPSSTALTSNRWLIVPIVLEGL